VNENETVISAPSGNSEPLPELAVDGGTVEVVVGERVAGGALSEVLDGGRVVVGAGRVSEVDVAADANTLASLLEQARPGAITRAPTTVARANLAFRLVAALRHTPR
jgi:hypothetical protein